MLRRTTNYLTVALAIALLGLAGACGDDGGYMGVGGFADSGPNDNVDADGGADATGADASSLDAGEVLPDAAMNAAGPIITVLSPTAPTVGDYTSGAILTTDRFTALCKAETNPTTGDQVDAATVRISATGSGTAYEAPAIPTGVANEFQADIVVSNFANGALEVRCSASDTAATPRENSQSIGTFLDQGPVIAILSPAAGTSFANQTDLMFTVTESAVAADDALATPDFANVQLQVSGTTITGITDNSGTFTGTIVFDDPIFPLSLDGQQTLTVHAPNLRTATPVVRTEIILFNVDSDGPDIDIVTPLAGELVSGIIPITATVTDPAGVQVLSVVATVAGIHELQLDLDSGNDYTGLFDTRLLGPMIFPNVIVRALDSTGNQSSSGYLIGLDNARPIISLDSPPMRESKLKDGLIQCSHQFDPLGPDSVSDGEMVAQLFELRARVEDLSNSGTANSSVIVPLAHVDPDSVDLFILDDENGALLVDTNGDGVCDEINPLLVPSSVPNTSNEVAVIDLVPVPSSGASFFGFDDPPTFLDTNNDGICTAAGETTVPKALCVSTPLQRVIRTEVGAVDAIYGVPPAEDLQCLGNAIDALATNLADGWVCSAVRGSDGLGNLNVSAPLRFCVDSDQSGDDGCPSFGNTDLVNAPDCTGTYDSQTNTVDTGTPCTVDLVFAQDALRRIDL